MQYHVALGIDLKRNPYNGQYIAIEGIDGSGKTTQVEKITSYFQKLGKKVLAVREPRKEGMIGDIIQKVLRGEITIPPVALQYLFSTDRVMHHTEVIVPALKEGAIVISDRCFWSAIVYGILDRAGNSYDYKDADALLIAQSILSAYHQFIVPDFTFYLKIPLATAVMRIEKENKKREIYEEEKKLAKVIKGYDWLSNTFSSEIIVIDGEKSVGEVTSEILNKLPK